jgi:hypothetical protein
MTKPVFTRAEYDDMERTIKNAYDVLEREMEVAVQATIPVFEMMATRLRQSLPDVDANDMQTVVSFLRDVQNFEVDSYQYRLRESLRLLDAQRSHTTYRIGRLDDLGLVEGTKPPKREKEKYSEAINERLFGCFHKPVAFFDKLKFWNKLDHKEAEEDE